MHSVSRPVDSNQDGVHPQLLGVLETHLSSEYRKPVSDYSRDLFARADELRRRLDKPVILDSGCGTGSATQQLADQHPEVLVTGIDKSSHRLARGGSRDTLQCRDNLMLIRMDLVDFWRLALAHDWPVEKHYLLYPNPWPKAGHLRRRWYAHPVFPQLLGLGGKLELRSNWRIYAEEIQQALNFIRPATCESGELDAPADLSLFEKKFSASGHRIYICHCDLDKLGEYNHSSGLFEPFLKACKHVSNQRLLGNNLLSR